MSGKTMTAILAAMTAACLLVMGVLAASGVRAEENCSLAADIVKELAGPKYGEKPAFIGTLNTPRGPVPFMAFLNAQTGTWTMLARPLPHIGCIVGAGQNFEWTTEVLKSGSGT
jgi:hypothetical protein